MAQLAIDLLGGFAARSARGRGIRLPRRKAQALLAFLALRPGHRFSREALTALLWGDVPDDQARHSLRQALLELRRALPPGVPTAIVVEGDQIALDPRGVEVDVATFERLAARDSPEALQQAATLYRGDLLEGLELHEPAFEDWLRTERARLRENAVRALRKLLDLQSAEGDLERAMATAMRLLAVDPLQEPAHRTLMQIYERMGRRADSLRQYERCVDVLRRELGVAPEPETRRAYEALTARNATTSLVQVPSQSPRVNGQDIPLAGRADEVEQIRTAIEDVGRGRSRVILLSGEAGIGKTRLLQEVEAYGRSQGFRTLLGRCYGLTRILTFGPWIEALRTAAVPDDPKLVDWLGSERRMELSRILPELGGSDLRAPERAEDHVKLFEAIVDLIEGLAVRQPLLVMLEDIHWADEMSVRLLFYLGRRLNTTRVLLAATFRDDELPSGSAARGMLDDFKREWPAVQIALGSLSRNDAVVLAHAIAKADTPSTILEQVGAQVWELSRGNPFMIVETMRSLPDSAAHDGPPPSSRGITELVERRLGQLEELPRGIVAIVAVAGRDIEFDVIRHASGMSEREAANAVELLIRRRILRGEGERFDFVHDIVRDAAGRQLIAPQRRALHRAVAEALEALRASTLDAHSSTLATHYLEAGVWGLALSYLARATEQAIERSAWKDALIFIERGLEALGRLPETAQTQETYIDFVTERYSTLASLGLLGHRNQPDDLLRARALAESLGDQVRLGRVEARLARCCHAAGETERGKEYARRAILAGEAGGDVVGPAVARHQLAEILHFEGDDRETISVARRNIEALSAAGDYRDVRNYGSHGLPRWWLAELRALGRVYLAWSLARQGEFPEALRYAHEALSIAESGELPLTLSQACQAVGGANLTRGDLPKAISALERGRQLSLTRVRVHRSGFASMLGAAYVFAGRVAEALPLLEEGAERESLTYVGLEFQRLAPLARAYSAVGRHDDALRAAERGLDLARMYRSAFGEAWLLLILAIVTLSSDPPDVERSLVSGADALTRSLALGTRPMSGHCHLALGQAHWAAGHSREGEEHIRTAVEMYRQMEMPYWLDVAEHVQRTMHA